MTCKMMYQIACGFYLSIKKWSKLGQKSFWLILSVFLFMPSYTSRVTPQDSPNERPYWAISVASFIIKAFVFVMFKILGQIQHPWNGPFLGFFLGPYFPRYCSIFLTFWPEVVSNKTNSVFEKSFKILNFSWNGR